MLPFPVSWRQYHGEGHARPPMCPHFPWVRSVICAPTLDVLQYRAVHIYESISVPRAACGQIPPYIRIMPHAREVQSRQTERAQHGSA